MSTTETSNAGPRLKPLDPLTLRDLSTKSNLAGAVRAASHYGMILIVGTLIWLAASRYGLAWALPLEQRGELPKELMQEPQLIL